MLSGCEYRDQEAPMSLLFEKRTFAIPVLGWYWTLLELKKTSVDERMVGRLGELVMIFPTSIWFQVWHQEQCAELKYAPKIRLSRLPINYHSAKKTKTSKVRLCRTKTSHPEDDCTFKKCKNTAETAAYTAIIDRFYTPVANFIFVEYFAGMFYRIFRIPNF